MDLHELENNLAALTGNRSDPDAWESLYRMVWPHLIGVLFRWFRGNREMAEEAAQEVMLRLLRFADFGEERHSGQAFVSYVNHVCRSVAAECFRQQGNEPRIEDVADLANLGDGKPDPEAAQITRDLIEKVAAQLSAEELEMAEGLMGGKPPEEAAVALHLSLPAYYQRVSRLRRRMKNILEGLSEKG